MMMTNKDSRTLTDERKFDDRKSQSEDEDDMPNSIPDEEDNELPIDEEVRDMIWSTVLGPDTGHASRQTINIYTSYKVRESKNSLLPFSLLPGGEDRLEQI